MDLSRLNPRVYSAALYEKINRTEECVGYDCRIIYIVSGDLSATVGGAKLGHLSPGHLLYIPAGTPYKLKSKYLRAVVISFDLTSDGEGCRRMPVLSAELDMSLVTPTFPPFDKTIHIPDMEVERDGLIAMQIYLPRRRDSIFTSFRHG